MNSCFEEMTRLMDVSSMSPSPLPQLADVDECARQLDNEERQLREWYVEEIPRRVQQKEKVVLLSSFPEEEVPFFMRL